MGIFGPPNIERMKARKDIRGLIKVLQTSRDSDLAAKAARALGEVGDANAVQPLLDEVRADHYGTAHAAAAALVQMAGRLTAIDLRGRLLKEWTAALCPEGILYSASRVHYDGDDDDFNRAWAKEEHRRFETRQIWDIGAGRRQTAARALGELSDAGAVEGLAQCLRTHTTSSYDDHTRRYAAEALGKIGDPSAIGPLERALQDSNEGVREAARAALVGLGVSLDSSPQA